MLWTLRRAGVLRLDHRQLVATDGAIMTDTRVVKFGLFRLLCLYPIGGRQKKFWRFTMGLDVLALFCERFYAMCLRGVDI